MSKFSFRLIQYFSLGELLGLNLDNIVDFCAVW